MMRRAVVVLVAWGCLSAPAAAQLNALRTGDGPVLLEFPARPGICGDGEHFVRIGKSYHGSIGRGDRWDACIAGPVQVLLDVRDSEVTRLQYWVGPVRQHDAPRVTLSGAEAARILLSIARTGTGRVASKAILPAVLADGAVVWPELLLVARDVSTRDRATRQDAALWLARFAAAAIAGRPNTLLDEDDRDDADDVKTHAVFVMSQLPRNESVPMLLDAARTNASVPVRNAALFWLSQSGDSRAIDLYEALLRR